MNPQPSSNNEQNPETKSEMELFFEEGEQYYREYLRLQGQTDTEWEDEEEKLYQIGFNRNMAIESLLRCVNQAVSHEQQNIRIHALFFLVELHPDREDSAKKEGYFYQAVELIRHYYGEDFQHTPEWKNIIDLYLNSIEPDFAQKFPKKYIPFLSPLLTVNILSECRTRMQERLEEAANIIQSGTYPDFHSDIIAWLEEIFGPMRISILSEEGNEEILRHRFDPEEKPEEGAHVYHTTVDIFDKEAKYIVSIDRGGSGEINTFKLSHLEHIIYPIIDIYIRKKEYALFTDISDHGAFIQQYEERAEHYQPKNNYGYFIGRVLSKYSAESSGDDVYKCQQSIDICRMVTAQHIGNNHFSGDALPKRIDTVLGGVIRRDVFLLVQSHLMTRYETMNGIGYPFRLSKNKIPIESRIYTIIRAYEALYSMYSYQPEKIISTLQEWGEGGYFDTDILSIFLEILRNSEHTIDILSERMPSKISEYRSNIYKIRSVDGKI